MSGDPINSNIWTDADVYVSFDTSEADPDTVDDPFAGGWEFVGLLDGDDGFAETREEDVNDHFAWGGILMKTSRAHFKLTRKFSTFETNDTTFRLRWPGSTQNGDIVVPRPERIKIAFETREGDVVHRLISAYQAEAAPDGDVTENETDPAKVQWIATIYPDTTESPAVLFHEQSTGTGS